MKNRCYRLRPSSGTNSLWHSNIFSRSREIHVHQWLWNFNHRSQWRPSLPPPRKKPSACRLARAFYQRKPWRHLRLCRKQHRTDVRLTKRSHRRRLGVPDLHRQVMALLTQGLGSYSGKFIDGLDEIKKLAADHAAGNPIDAQKATGVIAAVQQGMDSYKTAISGYFFPSGLSKRGPWEIGTLHNKPTA